MKTKESVEAEIMMDKKYAISLVRYLLCALLGGTIGFFYSSNQVIDNSISIIQKEYENTEYPVGVIDIQKKVDMQLGFYRGVEKLIGILSLLVILFFATLYFDKKTKHQ